MSMGFSGKHTIRELLEYRVLHTPDEAFCVEGDIRISHRMLDERVNKLTNGLIELGIRPGDNVAVMLGNHSDHIFTVFALAALGAIWVPVNTNLRGASLEWLVAKSSPRAIIGRRILEAAGTSAG